MAVELTTLCYLERGTKYLMLHRVKKENDINKDKWIGVGGHFEYGESPDECLKREVKEETGYEIGDYKCRGIVTFIYKDVVEYMHLYTGNLDAPEDAEFECDEGELVWIEQDDLMKLELWEGDKIFLKLLTEGSEYFSLKLVYDDDGNLIDSELHK